MNINILFYLLIGLLFVVFCILIIKGRAGLNNLFLRRVSMSILAFAILSLIAYTFYADYLLKKEMEHLKIVNDGLTVNNNTIDSLLAKEGGKEILIDSLNLKNSELERLLASVKSYRKIVGTGKDLPIIEKAKDEIEETKSEIRNAEAYNEILNKNDVSNALSEGFTFSGETKFFVFYPPQDNEGTYIDFSLKFLDEELVDSVAVIYIEVVKISDEGTYHRLFNSFYKPQKGFNKFKMYNYLKQKGNRMMVGFFWKSEFGIKENPRFEKTTYVINP